MEKAIIEAYQNNEYTVENGFIIFENGRKFLQTVFEKRINQTKEEIEIEKKAQCEANLVIKDWFLNKEFSSDEIQVYYKAVTSIEKETAKAVYVKFSSKFGTIYKWVPKSCIEK